MKNFRSIQYKHLAPVVHMGETEIHQALPVNNVEQVSPFILLHHFDFTREAGEHNFNIPPHPHRGFSPITFMYNGSIRHTDSLGNDMEIGDNEVQWINAGRGLIHSEKSGSKLVNEGGRMQGIQLWINTPKAHKMDAPSYQPITREQIPVIHFNGSHLHLVSGTYFGQTGPARSEVVTAMVSMEKNAALELELPSTHNIAVYVLEGDVKVNEEVQLPRYGFVSFAPGDGIVKLESGEASRLLLMAGVPLDEPLVTHGPFVMNSQTEILEAMRDYRENKMGFLY
jgi:redox-sensitive bicupin YhaK (pirin superfamily)